MPPKSPSTRPTPCKHGTAPSQTREGRNAWNNKNPKKVMLHAARASAKRRGLPCTITTADIVIPVLCPLLNIPLKKAGQRRTDTSPSLDKIIPELGYVPKNVWVISWRANRLKSDATLNELQLLVTNLTNTVRTFPWEKR